MKLGGPIARIVAKAALVVSVAALPACIVPPPLEPEQQTTQFPPPLLVSDPNQNPTDPPFGPLPLLITGYRDLNINAEDANENLPYLYARLFSQQKTGPNTFSPNIIFINNSDLLLVKQAGVRFRYSGKYPQERLCGYPNGTLIWLFVADFPFSDSDPTQPVKPGQMDSNFWELECS